MSEERYIQGYAPSFITDECLADELRIACSSNIYSSYGKLKEGYRPVEVKITVRELHPHEVEST